MDRFSVAHCWDRQYEQGRYLHEPPLPFVHDILAAAKSHALETSPGLYVGCGNGRNYIPLVRGGLDLVGLDLSAVALSQLRRRAPNRGHRLICGDLTALREDTCFGVVVGIQVFQHGDREGAHASIRAAQNLTAAGGLFCLRANAVDRAPATPHAVIERGGGETVRYLAGPKRGLSIRFFGKRELEELFGEGFDPVLPLRLVVVEERDGREWAQWEGIWRRL